MDRQETHFLSGLGALVIMAVLLVWLSGCEDNTAPDTFGTAPDVGALSLSPASVTLNATNTYAVFEVHGGTSPYRWSVSDPSLGTVPDTSASQVTYTRVADKFGVNVVTVVDKNRWSDSAEVYQE